MPRGWRLAREDVELLRSWLSSFLDLYDLRIIHLGGPQPAEFHGVRRCRRGPGGPCGLAKP